MPDPTLNALSEIFLPSYQGPEGPETDTAATVWGDKLGGKRDPCGYLIKLAMRLRQKRLLWAESVRLTPDWKEGRHIHICWGEFTQWLSGQKGEEDALPIWTTILGRLLHL